MDQGLCDRAGAPARQARVEALIRGVRAGAAVADRIWPGPYRGGVTEALAQDEPGAATAAALAGLDPGLLSDRERIEAAIGWDRLAAWVAAQQARVLATLPRPGTPPGSVEDRPADRAGWRAANPVYLHEVVEEVRLALRVSATAAERRLARAQALCDADGTPGGSLPGAWAELAAGRLSPRHVDTLLEVTAPAPTDVQARVCARVLHRGGSTDPAEFRDAARRALIREDPAGAAARRRTRARWETGVTTRPGEDGMGQLIGAGPAEEVAFLHTALDALARRALARHAGAPATPTGEPAAQATPLTLGAARWAALLDAVSEAFHRAQDEDTLPRRQGLHPRVGVVIDLDTLLGLAEHPVWLDGHGWVDPDLGRDLAADPSGSWHRLVTDPLTGELLDRGADQRHPAADLRRYVIARDRTCRKPHCHRPAEHCEIDHRQDWARGGRTTRDNLDATCGPHHTGKTLGAWTPHRTPDGTLLWTSRRTGRRYARPPQRYAPDPDTGPDP